MWGGLIGSPTGSASKRARWRNNRTSSVVPEGGTFIWDFAPRWLASLTVPSSLKAKTRPAWCYASIGFRVSARLQDLLSDRSLRNLWRLRRINDLPAGFWHSLGSHTDVCGLHRSTGPPVVCRDWSFEGKSGTSEELPTGTETGCDRGRLVQCPSGKCFLATRETRVCRLCF